MWYLHWPNCFLEVCIFASCIVSGCILAIILNILGHLTVLQIVGTCLALCLSSDLKSLSVVTEVSANGASEVSYFQVSVET